VKHYLNVIMWAIAGAILLGLGVIPGIPAWIIAPAWRGVAVGAGGTILAAAIVQTASHALAAPISAGELAAQEASGDRAAVAATALLLAVATLACWRHDATASQAAAAFLFSALATWSARSLFRVLGEGDRVLCRTHWGGLGGGLGGVELSRAATLLLLFVAASVAAVAAARPPVCPASIAPESGRGTTRLIAS
jgi:hypothetical protein